MNTVKVWNDDPSDRQVDEIAAFLQDGKLAVIPTDTMYAIVCNALDSKAIERLCRIKGINPDKTNLSIICSDISMASEYARINDAGFRILKDQTPGPYTILFKSASSLPKAFKGRKVVGIRIPDSNIARRIARRMGNPLLTTSIDYEDEDYGTDPGLIAEAYENQIDLMVEGERSSLTLSTIIDCTGDSPEKIREGGPLLSD